MQLSRKTLQRSLSFIKLRVSPSDHPFQRTKWMFLMQSGLLEQSLSSWLTRKGKTGKEKNCNKNNVPSKGKLKCRNSAGLVMLHALNKVRNKLKQPKTI